MQAALLFSDIVDWPTSNILFPTSPHLLADVLGDQLTRTNLRIAGDVTLSRLREAAFSAYNAHEQAEPGVWSLWHGLHSSPLPQQELEPELGFRLRLQNSLILPARDVPFDETISFRRRHAAQLAALRHHMDSMTIEVARGGWDVRETRVAIEKFDAALAGYLNEARRANFKKVFASLTSSSNWLGAGIASISAGAGAISTGLPLAQASLGALAAGGASLSLSSGAGLRNKASPNPYAYLIEVDRNFGD